MYVCDSCSAGLFFFPQPGGRGGFRGVCADFLRGKLQCESFLHAAKRHLALSINSTDKYRLQSASHPFLQLYNDRIWT